MKTKSKKSFLKETKVIFLMKTSVASFQLNWKKSQWFFSLFNVLRKRETMNNFPYSSNAFIELL